jgi:hypothetical protein
MSKWIWVIVIIIAVILFLLVALPTVAKVFFKKGAEEQVISLFEDIDKESSKTIDYEDIKTLPYTVKNWLINSNIVGKEVINTVRLKQEGRMRTTKNGNWMPITAEQYFSLDKPGFIWTADVKMAPLVHLSGVDTFKAGKGKMKIKILSLFPVVDAEGPEIDSGSMMRYLAEMMWFPSASLNPYIKWHEIDRNSVKATMTYKGISASGVFYFNDNGDIIRFMGKRYRDVNGKYILCDWGGINKEFKEFEGIRIPSKSDVTWFEEDGKFKWFEIEITELQYNEPVLY